jgi:alpha-L-rhamnosidase
MADRPAPREPRVELVGGDHLGRGVRPVLSWWLPERASRQRAYEIATRDGWSSGRVDSPEQTYVELPPFGEPRRRTEARLRVWTDLGESGWSDPVVLDAGLLGERDWTAGWIGVNEPARPAPGARPAYWLRTTVDTPGGLARLYVTALGLYAAFLDGERVGDIELTPGYTDYRHRVQYQAYDLTVEPGRHVLAVLLADGWYRGQVGMPRAADQFGTELAVRAQLEVRDGGAWTVAAGTGPDWRVGPSHVTAADLIGGERQDQRLIDPGIHRPDFGADGWAPAVARAVDVAIVASIAPPVRRVRRIRPVSVREVGGGHVVDLGQNVNGWLSVRKLGPPGTRLRIAHGEALDAGGDLTTAHLDIDLPILPEPLPLGQVDEVVAGEHPCFEPRFTTHGFRYARLDGHSGPLDAADVDGYAVHTDLRRTGWFSCSDDRLNRLHEAVVWSLRGNACDIPTDCPQRERAGWTGDWQVFAPTAAYLYDVLAFSRKWLRDLALAQRADGCVPNMAPLPAAEGFDGPLGGLHGSAGWGDVIVSAPWDLYEAYGDASLLAELWPAMTGWVDWAAAAARDRRHPVRAAARPRPAPHERWLWDTGFHWGEWMEPGSTVTDFPAFAAADKSDVATAYLARSAGTLARVADLIGHSGQPYADIAAGARDAWQVEFVRPDGTLSVQTQAAHVRALAFGLVPDELRPPVADRLVALVEAAGGHLSTGFLSTVDLLPVLADAGHLDTAYAVLLRDTPPSWLGMLARGATTMWEDWEGIDADGVPHASLNHYSKGAVASFLHRDVAGLRPTAPGYRAFEVRPRPGGGLTWAGTRHLSPYGPVEARWEARGGALTLDLTVPPGTVATVRLPGREPRTATPGRHRLAG